MSRLHGARRPGGHAAAWPHAVLEKGAASAVFGPVFRCRARAPPAPRTAFLAAMLAALMLTAAAVFAAAAASPPAEAEGGRLRVTVNNALPRRDTARHILNSHDGSIIEHNGTFFKYGTVQPDCIGSSLCKAAPAPKCGWGDNNFSIHSSPDLMAWTVRSANALPERPAGSGGFLPKVIYNAKTQLFVMWWTSRWYGVATSPSPTGPFTVITTNVTTAFCCGGSSVNFFLDETTGDAYLISNYEPKVNGSGKEQTSVELMTNTYTASTLKTSGLVGPVGSEGAVMVQQHAAADYLLITPSLCCFCPWGAGSSVLRAKHPLGPWVADGSWNGAWQSCRAGNGNVSPACRTAAVIPQQMSSMVKLNARLLGAAAGSNASAAPTDDVWMLIGDRWLSAPDHLKSHDYQAWVPLGFDESGGLTPAVWHNGTEADNWAMVLE